MLSRTAKFFLSIVILPALLSPSFAQQSAKLPSGTRSVVVNVFDAHGNVIRDLTRKNFRVRLNGKLVEVLDARYSLAPRRIVVLLDMSGSMTGAGDTPKWRIAREAVEDLLAQTPDDVSIAMLTFSSKVRDVFNFTQSRTAIAEWLKEGPGQRHHLKLPAKTALFDAILAGLNLSQPAQSGDVIYVITDGGDDASLASAVQTTAALLQSGVRLIAFLLPYLGMTNPSMQESNSADSFVKMVDDSGGFLFGVTGGPGACGRHWELGLIYDKAAREKVKVRTKELIALVNGFWMLELVVPSSNKASKMKLEVVDDDGRVRKEVRATYCQVLPTPT